MAVSARGGSVSSSQVTLGKVRIFEWNDTAWNQMGADLVGDDEWDFFGEKVTLSADGTHVPSKQPFW